MNPSMPKTGTARRMSGSQSNHLFSLRFCITPYV